jgi:hypothetical protein
MGTLYIAMDVGVNLGYVSYVEGLKPHHNNAVLTYDTLFVPKDPSELFQQSRLAEYYNRLRESLASDCAGAHQRFGGSDYERVLLLEDVTMVARNSKVYTKDWWMQIAIYAIALVVAGQQGFVVKTLTPREIKKTFTGDGKAIKPQMRKMYDLVHEGLKWPFLKGGVYKHEHVVDAFALLWCFIEKGAKT